MQRPVPLQQTQLRDVTMLCWVICAFLVTPLLVISQRQADLRTDFVYFYSLGRIANEHPPDQLYDGQIQRNTFQEVLPLPASSGTVYAPSPYPPFLALLFRPFAHLSFGMAQRVWQLCTLALFFSGLSLLGARFYPKRPQAQWLICAAALSFYPFIAETFVNAQAAGIAFLAFSLAICELKARRPFSAGLALSLSLYKPPLLMLFIPMLFVRKQWEVLFGFLSGSAFLIGLSTAVMGVRIWPAYVRLLLSLGPIYNQLNFSMYVDVPAFSTMIFSNHPWIKLGVLASSFGLAGCFLLRAWRSSKETLAVWAATITWTLVLNIYVPIYDTIILIPGMIATASVFSGRARHYFVVIGLCIFASTWATQAVARATGIQILTCALLLLGSLQLWACLRGVQSSRIESETDSGVAALLNVSPRSG